MASLFATPPRGGPMAKLRLALVTLVSVAVFLGLGVLGCGGVVAFFAHPARTTLVVVTILLAGAGTFSSGNLSSGVREDRGNRWVLAAFGVLGVFGAYLPAFTERYEIWT